MRQLGQGPLGQCQGSHVLKTPPPAIQFWIPEQETQRSKGLIRTLAYSQCKTLRALCSQGFLHDVLVRLP